MHKAQEWLLSHNRFTEQNPVAGVKKLGDRNAVKLAFTGGKGGVGKTSMAIRTSLSLAQQGFKVLLIDCDYNLSNTSLKLGLPVDDRFAQFYQGEKNLEDILYTRGNFNLLPGCNGNLNIYQNMEQYERLIMDVVAMLEPRFDFIVLDTPAGIKQEILNICAAADHRVFVVTPDKSSLTDSYSLMKILKINHGVGHNCLLINRIREIRQFNRVVKCLTDTVDQFLEGTLSVLGHVSEIECTSERFDRHFFSWEKMSAPQDFDKVLSRLVDEVGTTLHVGHHLAPRMGTNATHAGLCI